MTKELASAAVACKSMVSTIVTRAAVAPNAAPKNCGTAQPGAYCWEHRRINPLRKNRWRTSTSGDGRLSNNVFIRKSNEYDCTTRAVFGRRNQTSESESVIVQPTTRSSDRDVYATEIAYVSNVRTSASHTSPNNSERVPSPMKYHKITANDEVATEDHIKPKRTEICLMSNANQCPRRRHGTIIACASTGCCRTCSAVELETVVPMRVPLASVIAITPPCCGGTMEDIRQLGSHADRAASPHHERA